MNEIRIGDLRQRLVLESALRVDDGGGGANETWVEEAQLWALVRPLAGQERVEADSIAGRVTHEIWLRYRDGVEPSMRFRMDTRLFDIRAVMDVDERRRFLRCFAEERDL